MMGTGNGSTMGVMPWDHKMMGRLARGATQRGNRWHTGRPPAPGWYVVNTGRGEQKCFWTGLRWRPIPESYPEGWRYLED